MRTTGPLIKEQIEKIHSMSLDILEKSGVVFHDERAIDLFKRHGAQVEGHKVFIPGKLVNDSLKSAPEKFVLKARAAEKSVTIGEEETVCVPASGSVYISEANGERRKATTTDFSNFVRLCQVSDFLQVNGGALVVTGNIDKSLQNAFMMLSTLLYSDQPIRGFSSGEDNAKESIEMASLAYGGLEDNIVQGMANVNSPLMYDSVNLAGIREYVESGQPIGIATCSMAGSTSPVTLAGTLAVNNAEVLAGIVYTQLINPGARVIYGNTSSVVDMKTMSLALGSAESSLIISSVIQLADFYGVPCRTGGGLTDSKTPDMQAGYESMMHLYTSILGRASYVTQTTGALESFLTISREKWVIDEEIGKMIKRLLQGFEVNEETLAFNTIMEKGPESNFLESEHTFRNFRNELLLPLVSDRENYLSWKNKNQDLIEKANKIWKKRLQDYEMPFLAESSKKDLKKYVSEKYGQKLFDLTLNS